MSTYASQHDVERYIEGWTTTDAFALERLIQRAEREVDRIIIPINTALPPTQVISINAQSGNFTVGFLGVNTGNQAFGEAGSVLQAALQALPGIGAGNVTVLGNNPYTLVWERGWAQTNYSDGRIPVVTVNSAGLSPGAIVNVDVVGGRRLDPLIDLAATQALMLSNAVCAQVEYRNKMGEPHFVRAQYDSVRGPDFTTQGRLPLIGPKVKRELSGSGLILRGSRATGGSKGRRGVGRGWATY